MNEPAIICEMLGVPTTANPRTIAVIGLSEVPTKPSHYVSAYMQQHGYTIYPINPSLPEVLGQKSYASLSDLPIKPDIVNVFRLPKFIPAIVDEMLQLGLKHLWVQQGIVNLEAATRAEAGGIHVVMDRCIMVEHRHAPPPQT
jgi:predicted CoA-binding protein